MIRTLASHEADAPFALVARAGNALRLSAVCPRAAARGLAPGTSLADARALVKLLAGIPAKINLIPFNAWPGAPYECSEWSQIEKFAEIVNNAGYASPVRTPRGRDIMAACGQLKSESVKERASARLAAEKLADMQSGQLARMPH